MAWPYRAAALIVTLIVANCSLPYTVHPEVEFLRLRVVEGAKGEHYV
jgi:hypothetical protein